jgi:RNA-directed DNA polymerase
MNPINSERRLAQLLGTPLEQLREFARSTSVMYKPFVQSSGGKRRMIDQPVPTLRRLQRTIYRVLLRDYPYSRFAMGGVPGRSLRDALEPHQAKPLVVTVDIRDFYPSISDRSVYRIWRDLLGHGKKVAALLTRLSTFKGHLPQGASTSMALANLHLETTDLRIFSVLKETFPDLEYTRYVDDMVFSGSLNPVAVFEVTSRHLKMIGLTAHRARSKRQVLPRDVRQEVLGTVLNTGLSLSRHRRRLTRAIVHTAQKFGGDPQSVRGHIQYLRTYHDSLAAQLEDSLRLAPILFVRRGDRPNAERSNVTAPDIGSRRG